MGCPTSQVTDDVKSQPSQRKRLESWLEGCGLKCSSATQQKQIEHHHKNNETVQMLRKDSMRNRRLEEECAVFQIVWLLVDPLLCSSVFFHGQQLNVWRENGIVGSKPLSILHRPKFSNLFSLLLPNCTSTALSSPLLPPTNPPIYYFRSVHSLPFSETASHSTLSRFFLANRLAD